MKLRWKLLIALAALGVLGALVAANLRGGASAGVSVFTEKIARRDLEAVVRESGKVRAKRSVPLSANTLGQIKDVLVREGDRVQAGQVLIQIDPTPFETAIAQAEASVRDADTRLNIARTQLERTQKKLERETSLGSATSQERIDELEADIKVQTREVEAAQLRVESERARLDREMHELTKVRITSPIDGIVVRLNVEKGQNTVMGTMNAAGTELMTVADLSVLQVEIEVGEGAIRDVQPGQEARVEIDAIPRRKYKGKVSEVAMSPLPAAPGTERGVAFRVVITLDETIEGVRPGFSASAEIVTATRGGAIAVPIRALVARDLPVDDKDQPLPDPKPPAPGAPASPPPKKKTFEGAVVIEGDAAKFRVVKTGIAGKEHFEGLEGLAEGEEIVTGPHKSLRDLKDGEKIQRRKE